MFYLFYRPFLEPSLRYWPMKKSWVECDESSIKLFRAENFKRICADPILCEAHNCLTIPVSIIWNNECYRYSVGGLRKNPGYLRMPCGHWSLQTTPLILWRKSKYRWELSRYMKRFMIESRFLTILIVMMFCPFLFDNSFFLYYLTFFFTSFLHPILRFFYIKGIHLLDNSFYF